MGSSNEFEWLTKENVTSHQKATEISNEIPAALWGLGGSRCGAVSFAF